MRSTRSRLFAVLLGLLIGVSSFSGVGAVPPGQSGTNSGCYWKITSNGGSSSSGWNYTATLKDVASDGHGCYMEWNVKPCRSGSWQKVATLSAGSYNESKSVSFKVSSAGTFAMNGDLWLNSGKSGTVRNVYSVCA